MSPIDLPRERKVKQQTLIREPRTITPQEFNALSFTERLEMVRVSDPEFRYRLLLEAQDGPRIMRRLASQDVFLTLKSVGEEAVESLLPMIGPEQYTFCLDLDCWDGDRFDAGKGLQWLASLLEGEEAAVLRVVREMDFELLVLLLKKHVTVLHGPEDINDDDARIEAMRRDGGYAFTFVSEDEGKIFIRLFDLLFRLDPGFYTYLIEATRGEGDALLEESVYGQRTDRLYDAGFPDPVAAKSIYAWRNPATFATGESKRPMTPVEDVGAALPAFMLIEASPHDLLAAALVQNQTPSTIWELACLANQVLLADGVDLADRDAIRQSLDRLYQTFNLALEYLCGSREDAVELLDKAYFQHLFQVGHSLKLRLQRRADKLRASAVGPFLDGPCRAFVDALRRRPHPLYYSGIDQPGEGRERPFRSAIDLAKAEKWLDQIEAQHRLFTDRMPFPLPSAESLDLTGCHPSRIEEVTLSQIFLTALANRVMGRGFVFDPIAADELPGLHGSICRDKHLDQSLREEMVAWADTLVAGAGRFADWCLDIWELEFCPVDPGEMDPRFVGGLVVRRD